MIAGYCCRDDAYRCAYSQWDVLAVRAIGNSGLVIRVPSVSAFGVDADQEKIRREKKRRMAEVIVPHDVAMRMKHLETQAKNAHDALLNYGDHRRDCNVSQVGLMNAKPWDCTCAFEAAVQASSPDGKA